jgi:hypothetical protein
MNADYRLKATISSFNPKVLQQSHKVRLVARNFLSRHQPHHYIPDHANVALLHVRRKVDAALAINHVNTVPQILKHPIHKLGRRKRPLGSML